MVLKISYPLTKKNILNQSEISLQPTVHASKLLILILKRFFTDICANKSSKNFIIFLLSNYKTCKSNHISGWVRNIVIKSLPLKSYR